MNVFICFDSLKSKKKNHKIRQSLSQNTRKNREEQDRYTMDPVA